MIPFPGSDPLAIPYRYRRALLLLEVFILTCALTGQAASLAGDWAYPRADLQATGRVADSLPEKLSVLWEFEGEHSFEAPVIVVENKLYAADSNGLIYAVDVATGKEIWRFETELGFTTSPVVQDGLLVVGDVDGEIFALVAETGKLLWKAKAKAEISGAATFYNDLVLITSQDGKLYALSKADGKSVWTYETSDQIRCSPTIAGDRTFLGGCDGNLHNIRLSDGTAASPPLPLGGPTGSTPAVMGHCAYLPVMAGAVMAFDWQENKELWRYEDEEREQEYRSSAAVSEKHVIVSSQNKQVDALDRITGKRLWRYTLRRRADGSPVIAGEDCWIASTDGRLTRLSIADGSERWNFEIAGQFITSPSIANNRLYIPDNKGVIRCFGSL